MNIGDKIRMLRLQNNLTLEQVGNAVGVGKSTVRKWETGEIANMRRDKIVKLATVLHTTPTELVELDTHNVAFDVQPNKPVVPVAGLSPLVNFAPILGTVRAGMPMFAEENIEGYQPIVYNDGHKYAVLHVRGDSMNAAGMDDGDCIVIRAQDVVDDNQIAVVCVNGNEATVKRFHQQGDTVILSPQSYNPLHQPQIYNLHDVPIRIFGLVVQIVKTVH